jgi:hypothetical protein
VKRVGQTSSRTTTDPRFADPRPLVPTLVRIAGADPTLTRGIWIDQRWLIATRGDPGRLLLWDDLDKPPRRIADVCGSVNVLAASPEGDRLAVVAVHQQKSYEMSSADPAEVVIVGLADGGARSLVSSTADFAVGSRMIWSPDGRRIAIAGHAPTNSARRAVTGVFDVASGARVALSPPSTNGRPAWWDSGGLILESLSATRRDDLPLRRSLWSWLPGEGDPQPTRDDPDPVFVSPDKRFAVVLRLEAIEICCPHGGRRFAPEGDAEQAAVAAMRIDGLDEASWIGPHALVLRIDPGPELVLDLDQGKLRYLFTDEGATLHCASADGRLTVARDANGDYLWGRAQAS